MTWYSVDVGYACAGVEERDGRVTAAAPIYGWAIGKPWAVFMAWVKRKGGKLLEA